MAARLFDAAHERRVSMITGDVLAANQGLLRFAERLGFRVLPVDEPEVRRVVLQLRRA